MSDKVVQLNSSDGHTFVVPIDLCRISNHITDTINMSDPDDEKPVLDLVSMNGANLEKIVEFMRIFNATPLTIPLAKPVVFNDMPTPINEFVNGLKIASTDLQDINGSDVSLISLMIAANTLQIESLKQLLVCKLIDTVRDKNMRQMNVIFGIDEDYVPSPEEVHNIRETYSYAFE